jgi:hypothetical protein
MRSQSYLFVAPRKPTWTETNEGPAGIIVRRQRTENIVMASSQRPCNSFVAFAFNAATVPHDQPSFNVHTAQRA